MLGGMGGFPGMGGGGFGGPDWGNPMSALPPALAQFDQTCDHIALGLVSARVRTRAILELLEEKGIFAPGQFDDQAAKVWERDHEALAKELTAPPADAPAAGAPAAEPVDAAQGGASPGAVENKGLSGYYTELLASFVDDAVASRVRLRTIITLLEERGIFAPGDFDKKAELIWDRDYEELALEFHQRNY